MAGSYPGGAVDSGAGGSMKECNMCGCYNNADPTSMATAGAASAFVYSHWPPSVRLVFSGVEVGVRVRSGAVLEACAPADSPCRRAFLDYKRDNPSGWAAGGRCSWDPLTTLVGVLGASAERTGVEECTDCDGTNQVDSDGSNRWVAGPPSNQSYLVLKNATAARPVHSVGLGLALPGQGAAEELNGSAKRCVAQAAGEAIDALLCQRPSASRGQRRSVEER